MTLEVFRYVLLALLLFAGIRAFADKKAAAIVFSAVVVGLFGVASAPVFAAVGTILLLLVLSTPLFVTLGVLTFVCFYFLAEEYQDFHSYTLIIEKIFTLTDKNVLLAIPYFVVAGNIMTKGAIAQRIVAVADALVGWLPGGLAAAAVLACMFFAAISGSSPVTVIAIGSIMMPALVKGGYDDKFSLGLVTSAGSLGILIPPSIPMIVYAIMVSGSMSVNVADLFLAGIGPGLVIGGLLIAYSIYHGATRPDFSWRNLKPPTFREVWVPFVDGFWALLLPIIILGGIYPIFGPKGLFTPTEAAAVAVVYAFVVEMFIHRELKLKDIPPLLVESTVLMGALLIILILSFAINHYLVDQQIPDAAVTWMTSLDLERFTFLLMLNVFLLVIGCLMDIMSAIMIVAPLVAPIAESFGISAVHLGVVFVVNLEIGYLTPPIGLNLFVSSTLFGKPIGYVMKSVIPFTLLMLLGLGIVTWVEPVSVGVVRVINGQPFVVEQTPPKKPPKIVDDDDDDDDDDDSKPSGVKSIEELMNDTATTSDSGGVKSIEELMNAADDEDDDDDDDDDDDSDSGGVKSIEELMNEADSSDAKPKPKPKDDGKVKSIEELMNEADE